MSTPIVSQCPKCGSPITLVPEPDCPHGWVEKLRVAVSCDACARSREAELRAQEITRRIVEQQGRWNEVCPPEFRKEIDFTKRGAKKENWAHLYKWEYGTTGLYIYGKTGLCKTRFSFQLLRRELFKHRRRIGVLVHTTFRQQISGLLRDDFAQAERVCKAFRDVELLLIDDLGKGVASPAAETALWDIIDQRASFNRPNVITTNDTVDKISEKLTSVRSSALLRRIEDHHAVVAFV